MRWVLRYVAEQEQNRTEKATPFKLKEAKNKGQVAKSLDFNTFVMIWALLLGGLIWGGTLLSSVAAASIEIFSSAGQIPASVDTYAAGIGAMVRTGLAIIVPVAIVAMLFSVFANLVQTGPIFSVEPLKPKFERINPIAGFKRVYNKRMLFEGFKSLLKLLFFLAVIYFFFRGIWDQLPEVETKDVAYQIGWLGDKGSSLLFRLALALTLVGLLDLAYVRWSFGRQMMMSRREMKEEIKRREGDPLIRAKLKELQRENLKQAQSMSRVPDADVLITNPSHLAVALRYVPLKMNAPMIIAKGAESWAAEMRATAARHEIPVIERKRLARLLFKEGDLEAPVPPSSFLEVARVYAEIDARKRAVLHYEAGA